jgi:hypothetical protein
MPIDRNTPYRDVGPVPYELWRAKIAGAGGRAELASRTAWIAAGTLSGVLLRILNQESSYDTDYNANAPYTNNPYNIRVPDRSNEGNPKGYVAYPSLVDATDAARKRLEGRAGFFEGANPYAKTETIEELLNTYAPPKWNDTEGLIKAMVRDLNAWLPNWSPPVTTPSTPEEPIPMPNVYKRVPHPPYIDLPVSKPSGGGYGYTQIPTGSRRIVGVMNHETQGRGTGPWYRDFFSCPNGDRCSDALVDYLIQRDGKIYRLNDPRNNRSPWANGGTLGLEGDGPAFYARFGATGVNNALISIEFEKTDGENYTEAQVQSGGLLNAYWHDQDEQDWDTYPYVPRYSCVTSLAHYEIGTTNCGQGELDDIGKLQAVAKGEMKKWQTQAGGPSVPEVPEVPEQPEIPTLPGGLTVAEAAKRFGTLTRHAPDGSTKVMPFDPKGPISLSWLHRCVETGEWPQAQDWWALSDSGKALDIVTFSNDWQMIRTAERQAIMWARFADAELEEAA